jgi:8-oxo-dGTP pyrophosphatase MutT (NUDIX family)
MRALADTPAASRPRQATDGGDPAIPVAATVVIARDSANGPEVLLIERPDRGAFAGAWVFPGGKLEPADALAGVADEPEEDVARRAGIRETFEECGLVLAADGLVTVSVWDPPPGVPSRIRTWFFLAHAPHGDLILSADEVVAAAWLRPDDALTRHGAGELVLYPPTWVTLHALAEQDDVASQLAAARLAGVRRFDTVARRTPAGPVLVWAEDAEYDESADGHRSARHRLEVGGLPWTYTRS